MIGLDSADWQYLTNLRRDLHRQPELSGKESDTAQQVESILRALGTDQLVTELGGHGVAAVYVGTNAGPTVMIRCELDALPIAEGDQLAWQSRRAGAAHKCGHDGHVTILAAVAMHLSRRRPARGRVVLLFQPAEETGAGARAVLDDPRFDKLRPDQAYALHNVPGYPLGQVLLRAGSFCCGSRGLIIRLTGRSAHAAQPETGISPTATVGRLLAQLDGLHGSNDELAFVTVVGARLGEAAFGTAPGDAEIMVTVRSESDSGMDALLAQVNGMVVEEAAASKLAYRIEESDVFPATINGATAVTAVRNAARGPVTMLREPFRWSEDFGHFTRTCDGALFGLGAGEDCADLHDPAYDFPDQLTPRGAEVFVNLIADQLGPG